jgi:hypothetical protein
MCARFNPQGKDSDKGFNITDVCHERGLLHNRTLMKFAHQFDETEVVKNYIGRIRDWKILNKTFLKTTFFICFVIWFSLSLHR